MPNLEHDFTFYPIILIFLITYLQLHIGLGTTPDGFQIKALSEVYRTSNGVTRARVPHGTRVYTTLIAENHAGLRSVFHAKPITIDHTAPVFYTVPTLTIEDAINESRSVLVNWDVEDIESGIKKCLCGLGSRFFNFNIFTHCSFYRVFLSVSPVMLCKIFVVSHIFTSADSPQSVVLDYDIRRNHALAHRACL